MLYEVITGKPGANYWQNTADYKMEVSIDPIEKTISGTSVAIYYNHSPKSINSIVIRLYYDVYRKGAERSQVIQAGDISDEGVDRITSYNVCYTKLLRVLHTYADDSAVQENDLTLDITC